MSAKRRKMKRLGKREVVMRLLAGILAFFCSGLQVLGVYPLVPAFYAGCVVEKKRNLLVYLGMFAGIGYFMPVGAAVKYGFIILISGMAIHLYRWANRKCSSVTAALLAGGITIVMDCSGLLFASIEYREAVIGLSEGICVFGLTVLFRYLSGMGMEMSKILMRRSRLLTPSLQGQEVALDTQGKLRAFAEAVDGLSAAFAVSGRRQSFSGDESVAVLEREITGKLCASCEGCEVCWQEKGGTLSVKIHRMLMAVIAHSPKEEILKEKYMEDCPRYSGMVEEAIWAFSRMELNEAWYKRLQENRLVIASQLDAMADALQDWDRGNRSLDKESRLLLMRIGFEVQEKGLVAENVHIFEDEKGRHSIHAMVRSKWGGGIPSRNYRMALERATGLALRLQQDARTILTQDPVSLAAYEDTCYDILTGTAFEKQEGSAISGDNASMFFLEDGRYFICLSDGMGSGPAAGRESDMVVDLMEKFMTAGFPVDTAIRLMNSAMVLKGEDDSFSTLDFASIDLYTGELELTKIGAAASFIRHGSEVCCIPGGTLPAGVEASAAQGAAHAKLVNGDFLVMVTDGVLEYLHVKNPEEKISEMIGMIETDNPSVLAEKLMEHVMLFTGGHALDDMTVIAAGIWEK